MDKIVLQLATMQALQQFLSIWRQDPAAQYNLEICPQNTFLWDSENPIETYQVTTSEPYIEEPAEMPSLIETTPEVTTDADLIPDLDATVNEESKQYQETKEELMQPLGPQTRNHLNPFLNDTLETQLSKILQRLDDKGRARPKQVKLLETYLYLGILIDQQPENQTKIRQKIQTSQGHRKTQDIWKGAQRLQQIFSLRPKELLYQTRHLTVTHIVKLKDKEFQALIKNLQSKFS